jgi:PAS domain S-box-containing protein
VFREPSTAAAADPSSRPNFALALGAATLVFGADLLAPSSLHVAVLHVAIVVAATRLRERRAVAIAAVCAAFAVAAGVLGRPEPLGAVLLGRGLLVAAIGVVAVLESRRRRELTSGERTFRGLLEAAPDAMVIVDERGRIVLVNSQAEHLFGYDRRELLGQPVERLIPAELHARHQSHRAAYAAEPKTRTMGVGLELAAVRKDGSTFPVEIALGPLSSEQGTFVSAAIRDITDRKRQEHATRDFLATLGHELRNPLAAIRNAERLLRHPGVSAEQAIWSQDIIESEGRHMTRLIDDLLDLSRVARNTIELRRERVELTAIMDRALDSARGQIEQRGHQIAVALPRGPLFLDADPVRLTQVFSNLLDNAAKYSPPGGRIEVSGRREAGALVVGVRDDGIGISAEARSRLFDMFFRADRSLEQQEGGLGIGLTLVRQLVELHGGTVEAASEGPGRGSTFTVRLPVREEVAPLAADGDADRAAPAARTRRVLVVDDNRGAADSLAVILRLDGHEVAIAYDGRTALVESERLQPEVVLLDIGMPGMNGYEVARAVRAREWGTRVYLVALTGLGTSEDRERAQEAGFDTHLVKPVDLDALTALLTGPLPSD